MPNSTRRFAHLANQRAALGTVCQKPAIVWQIFCNGHPSLGNAWPNGVLPLVGKSILANGHPSFGNALPTLAGLPLARPCHGQSVPWARSARRSALPCETTLPCKTQRGPLDRPCQHAGGPGQCLPNQPVFLSTLKNHKRPRKTKNENYLNGRARL